MNITKATAMIGAGEIGRWLFATEEAASEAATNLALLLKTNVAVVCETANVPIPTDTPETAPAPPPATVPIQWN